MTVLEHLRTIYPEYEELPVWALWALVQAGEVPERTLNSVSFRERLFGAGRGGMVGGHNRMRTVRADGSVVDSHPPITTFCEAWLHETCQGTSGLILFCQCRCHRKKVRP